ncbi:glycosyltransferase 87 family protein [Kutzneria chonburiensis]|uniref:Glycosyltransferase 87 family protein n=1 Tax=Kutzneria chonburiensis TaxID=1483604 RepID=A0ABV6MZ91_9PSEU|nr:glycosyltransferase 87 family protein [Kutzneria chonburiensis]
MDVQQQPPSTHRSPVELILWSLVAAALLALIVLSTVYIGTYNQHHFTDLYVYLGGGDAWRHGQDLYQTEMATPFAGFLLKFTYPPLAAVLFAGLAVFPLAVAIGIFTTATLVILFLCIRAVLVRIAPARLLARFPVPIAALVLTLGAAWLEPVRETISFGQVNVLLLGLIVADCLVAKPWWPRGLLIGLAASIKLTPAAFVLFFLARKDWKAALTMVGGFVGFGLVGFALAAGDSVSYWFQDFFDTNRVGNLGFSYNQSLRGMVARLGIPANLEGPLWVLLCLGVLALAWLVARRSRLAGQDLPAMLAIGVLSLLVSPVSWAHHWVWAVLAILWGAAAAIRARSWLSGALSLFAVYLFWQAPYHQAPELRDPGQYWDPYDNVIGNAYVWLAIAVLIAMTVWSRGLAKASDRVDRAVGAQTP